MGSRGTGSDGLVAGVGTDIGRLLARWRALVFPRQIDPHPVRGPWRPGTLAEHLAFWAWSLLGIVLICLVYPVVVVGLWIRYVTHRVDRAAAALGLVAVVLVVGLVWGALTALAWERLPRLGFRAVLAASVVATASAGLAWGFTRLGGRGLTVAFAYPFAVSAVLLPPVTAALFSPTLGAVVLPGSTSVAEWLLANVAGAVGLETVLRREFELAGAAFVGMWFGIGTPVGWLLGLLVTLADAVRPRARDRIVG
ncbi:MAG: hypothetical protein ABEH40_09725 [Haloferacaceae archaeon]